MLRGAEVEGSEGRQAKRIGDGVQAVPNTRIASSPTRATDAIGNKRSDQHDHLQRLLVQKEVEVEHYRDRAEEAEHKLELVTDQNAQLRQEILALTDEVKEKTDTLVISEALNKALKRRVDTLKNRTDLTAWADEPTRGAEALARLRPGGVAAGHPRFFEILARWSPGVLRDAHMYAKRGACACKRELAGSGLAHPKERFEDIKVLGQGAFGVVQRGRCRKTQTVYAVKNVKPGSDATILLREMAAYAIMGSHKNVVSVEALSDVSGSEGLVMEMAVCDLYQASTKTSVLEFTLEQIINFEADASEGLAYMHSVGIVHCDHKLANTLVCRSDDPAGFIGKVADPGCWCGVGERRPIKTGDLGRVPPENVLGEVVASPNQDVFAFGVDLCFILTKPALRTKNDCLWLHWALLTPEENARGLALHTAGANMTQHWHDISLRTKTDGSLARILLQPGNLNPMLPPSDILRICEVLRNMVSSIPTDRGEMASITSFLRDLAAKTTAHVAAVVAHALESGVALPPLVEHPPVMAAPSIAPASGLPAAGPVRVAGGRSGGAPAGVPSVEPVHFVPLPVAAPHAEREAGNSSEPQAAGTPAAGETAEAANAIMPSLENTAGVPSVERVHLALPPVAVPIVEGDNGGADAAVFPIEAVQARNDSGPPAAGSPLAVEAVGVTNAVMPSIEDSAARVPSVGRMHLAPPPGVASHSDEEDGGAGADVPAVEAVEPPRGSEPPAVNLAGTEAANAVMPSLEEIAAGEPSVEGVHLAPHPVVVPRQEGEGDDAGAAVRGSAPLGPPLTAAGPPMATEPANDATPSLDEIARRVDVPFRPFPTSPGEVLANHMADVWRTLGCPQPSVSRLPAGQACRSGSGSGSGSGGGDISGGSGGGDVRGGSGGGGGRGRTVVAGASRGALPGLTAVKGRDPLMSGSSPFWAVKCFFWKIFW